MFVSARVSRLAVVVIGRWKFLCIQFDILQSRACHNLCLIILYRVHPIQFKYTRVYWCHRVVTLLRPWLRRRSRRSLIREWFDLNDGMLPPLPLSFSPTWSLDKCQSVCPFGEEIKADLWRGIHYETTAGNRSLSACDHSLSIQSDSIQLNADDRGCHAPTETAGECGCCWCCLASPSSAVAEISFSVHIKGLYLRLLLLWLNRVSFKTSTIVLRPPIGHCGNLWPVCRYDGILCESGPDQEESERWSGVM